MPVATAAPCLPPIQPPEQAGPAAVPVVALNLSKAVLCPDSSPRGAALLAGRAAAVSAVDGGLRRVYANLASTGNPVFVGASIAAMWCWESCRGAAREE